MPITAFDHYTTRTQNFDKSFDFYTNVLGFKATMMPVPFRLAILDVTENCQQHLVEAGPQISAFVGASITAEDVGPIDEANISRMTPSRTNNFEHLVFNGTNFEEMAARFRAAGIPYLDNPGFTGSGAGAQATSRILECMDPDGIKINIYFPADEAQT